MYINIKLKNKMAENSPKNVPDIQVDARKSQGASKIAASQLQPQNQGRMYDSQISYRPTVGEPWDKPHDSPGDTWRDPTWPVGYKVPNFGKDADIIATQVSNAAAEKEKEPM